MKQKCLIIFILLFFANSTNIYIYNYTITPSFLDCQSLSDLQYSNHGPLTNKRMSEIGDEEQFYVHNFIQSDLECLSFTLRAIGTHCYLYVTSCHSITNSTIETYVNEFDTTIYPNETAFFGSPDGTLGDIDGDPKVSLLIYPIDGSVGGYYSQRNEHSSTYSNEREMVYLDIDMPVTTGIKILAHEFNHLIHYNWDQDEYRFLDEAFAELSVWITGYQTSNNLSWSVSEFELYSWDSLLYWDYYYQ